MSVTYNHIVHITTYGYDGGMKRFLAFFVILIAVGIYSSPSIRQYDRPHQTKIYSDIGKKLLLGDHLMMYTSIIDRAFYPKGKVTIIEKDETLYLDGFEHTRAGFIKMNGIITEVHKDRFVFDGTIHLYQNLFSRNSSAIPYVPGQLDCVGSGLYTFYMGELENGSESAAYWMIHRKSEGYTEYWFLKKPQKTCIKNGPSNKGASYDDFSVTIFIGHDIIKN